ncbi:MAG: helicase-related protein, partial [Gemmatimonadales bacterium]
AHHFRHHGIRRVQTIAPWLVGRRVLLLTATPIVNRRADLITLLRLALPEDGLALDGISRLGDLEHMEPPPALRRVVIRSSGVAAESGRRLLTTVAPDENDNRRGAIAVAAVDQLALSRCAAIHRLIASVVLDAAASSDAAFHQALKRYRALLLQGRDAGGASRAMLRQFAGEALDQLVLWPLLATTTAHPVMADLQLSDLPRVERLVSAAPNDGPWITALAARCGDDRPTICFTRHRATALRLREAFGDATAWITGSDAGIGPHRVAREAVLDAFGPRRAAWRVLRTLPRLLVATDVAAEGLDLHAAGRIVHIDLPWTATRLEQREGRLVRLGQQHDRVEVVVRMPAAAIEAALIPHGRVRRKRRLADEWLSAMQIADACPDELVLVGPLVTCVEDAGTPVALVAVRLQRDQRVGTMIMIQHDGRDWHTIHALSPGLLQRVRAAHAVEIAADDIADRLRTALRVAVAATATSDSSASSAMVTRIHRSARHAAVIRDGATMQRLDRMLRFVTTPPTLGSRIIMARLAAASDDDFVRAEPPDLPRPGTVKATVIAALLVRNSAAPRPKATCVAGGPTRGPSVRSGRARDAVDGGAPALPLGEGGATLIACPASRRCCSISTAPSSIRST